MRFILKRSLFIVVLITLTTGCSLKSNDELFELKPNVNTLTKRVNSAIERRGIAVADVDTFLNEKYPSFMQLFKEYDLKFKYENEVTVVLVCQEQKAIFEDMSCDLKIDEDYSGENKECEFYIQEPSCQK